MGVQPNFSCIVASLTKNYDSGHLLFSLTIYEMPTY